MKLTTIDLLTETPVLKATEKLKGTLECKFVQLTNETEHFLIFGALHQYNYHAQLVEKFCLDKNVKSTWRKTPDIIAIKDISYKIQGGGWFSFDFLNKKLTAMGMSTAYGRFNEEIFKQFIDEKLIFKDFTIKMSH